MSTAQTTKRAESPAQAKLLAKAIESYNAGDYEAAVAAYEKVLAKKPHPEALFMLGVIRFRQGNNQAALELVRRATEGDPQAAPYYMTLGVILDGIEDIAGAVASFKRALEINPDDATTWSALAETWRKCADYEKALACLEKALALAPRNAELHRLKGYLCYKLDRNDEARACYEKALELKPVFPQALVSLGMLLTALGDREAAREAFEKAVAIAPQLVAAQTNLAQLTPRDDVGAARERLVALEALEAGGAALTVDDRQMLHFARGGLRLLVGEHEAAFADYTAGNAVRATTRGSNFDIDAAEAGERALCDSFDEDFFADRAGQGVRSEVPVLVVGMPRSGTTLIERIIGSHPQAFGAGELMDLGLLRRELTRGAAATEVRERMREVGGEAVAAAAESYLAKLRGFSPEALRVVDKMPLNFEDLWLIAVMLPGARVIHARRSPLDTCLSCFFTDFSSGHGYRNDLATLGRYYRRYRRLMDHWLSCAPVRFLPVQYEDVVTQQDKQSRRLLQFCGLSWDDACLEFHRGSHAVRTASSVQVRRSMYTTSVGRWRAFEAQLGPLMEALGEDLVEESRRLAGKVESLGDESGTADAGC